MNVRLAVTICMCAATLSAADGLPPKVIAHRGGPAQMPENTVAAFRNAIGLGVEVLEFDMNVTADDEIVIHHDSVVNSSICASGSADVKAGPIRLMPLEILRRFDCGSTPPRAHPRQVPVPGARMPTLDELLSATQGSKVLLLGETKMPPPGAAAPAPARFVELIHAVLKKHQVENRFILQSSDYRTIDEMRKKDSRIATCLLGARRHKPDYLEIARRHKATHLMLRTDDVDRDGVRKLQAAGIQVFSGTANTQREWREYLEMGMDGILTDDPKGLIEFLRQEKARN